MDKKDLKILFMGTPEFAKESLKALVENSFNVIGVFCQPDKPKGRGMKLMEPPVKEYAKSCNIPVYQPNKLKNNKDIEEILVSLVPDLIVVVAYGKILPKYILDFPRLGCINVHGSLLPKYRGAAPIQWSIINGENITGITTMYMDEGMDTGDMITKAKLKIEKDDTYGSLHDKLMYLGAKTLINDLEQLLKNNGKLNRTKQSNDFIIAPMLSKDSSKIDFNNTAETIDNLVRGTNPFPGAWCKLDEERIYKIYKVKKIEYDCSYDAKQGEIVYLNDKKNMFIAKCKDGYINILELKAPGTKLMTCGEYIRGGKIKVHSQFI